VRIGLPPLVAALLAGAATGSAGEPAPEPIGFGTAHPSILEVADPAGRWVVVCQARADTDGDGEIVALFDDHHGAPYGDTVIPYLVISGGEGTAIDALIGVDPRSRYVVGSPKGRVTLYDTRTGTATDLTPRPATEGQSTSVEPWASFDDAGRRLLTARVHGTGKEAVTRLVVRELETGVETSLDPGAGLLVRAALSGDGASVAATVVTDDTDGDGELELPKRRSSFYEGGCGGPPNAGSVFGWSGDKPIHRVLAVDGTRRRDVPGFLRFVGRRWIRRLADGSLVLEGTGEPTTIAPAALKAKILASDDATTTLLWASAVGDEATPVFAAGPSGVREIGVRARIEPRHREWRHQPARITPLVDTDDGAVAFDWSKGVAVHTRGRLVTCEGPHVLVLRGESLVVMDVDAATETPLPGTIDHFYGRVLRAGTFAAMNGLVIDLAHAKVVGTYPFPYPYSPLAPEWALRDDGALLRSGRSGVLTGRSGISLPLGPLRWESPAPAK
jgi:hypothetical protein